MALTEKIPESFKSKNGDWKKGVRIVTVCTSFFSLLSTKANLPTNTAEVQKYCENQKKKKIEHFETGGMLRIIPHEIWKDADQRHTGHTILHEITHLDSFGVQAGFPGKYKYRKGGSFVYHGTDDFQGDSSTSGARNLKWAVTSQGISPTWANAESLAAAATEIYAMKICGIDSIRA